MTPTCICQREMTPVVFTQGDGWVLYYACFDHPGKVKLSTASFPLPASLAPAPIALGSEK